MLETVIVLIASVVLITLVYELTLTFRKREWGENKRFFFKPRNSSRF